MTARSRRGAVILGVLAVTNLVTYAARNALNTTYDDLRHHLALTDDQLGLLSTVFMIAQAVATLPLGLAGDRFDRRRLIAGGVLLASLAGMAGAAAGSFEALAASRALVGLGAAAVVPLANSVLGQVFEGPVKASRIAIFNLGLFLGGVSGFGAGAAFGFPVVLLAIGAPGVALAVAIALLPVPPHPAPPTDVLPWWRWLRHFVRDFARQARLLLRIRTLRWVMGSTTAMAFASGGYLAWFFEFLKHDKGMSEGEAGRLLGATFFGGLAGIIAGGRVGDRLRRRLPEGRLWTVVIGMATTVPCAVLCIQLPAGVPLTVASVAMMCFISWYHAPVAATVDDLAPPAQTAAAQALVIFTMHTFGTAPASWLTGLVSRHVDLHAAMWLPTALVVVAALCMAVATRSFAADAARARGAGPPPPAVL